MIDRFFNNRQKQLDQQYLEFEFTLGRSISKGIPWKDFSEKDIQGILKIHFERLGFRVVWRHCDDPANEKGVDLECTNKNTQKRVVIAVKKKPKLNDLGQILQLSQYEADQRIYLYINGAAQSFRDQMVTFDSKIEFWDEKILETILEESGLTLWLKIDNSYAIQAINSINKNLFGAINIPPQKQFPKPNKTILKTLWDLKDRAVTLNKCATMAQLMYEDSKRLGKMSNSQILNLQIWCLDYLFIYSLLSLSRGFELLSNDMKIILSHIYERTNVRSNWFMLDSIHPGLTPGNIESLISHNIQDKSSESEAHLSENKREQINESVLEDFYFREAAREFRCIGIWADGLEGTIDDMFEGYLAEKI